MTVQDIVGGHRVTITDKDGAKVFDVMDGTGGGGASPAIVDVVELPTSSVNDGVFYRLVTGTFYVNGKSYKIFICHVVNALPETGEPATDSTMTNIVAYYNTKDATLNGYLPAELAAAFGLPAGWYPAELLFQAAGVNYGGVVTSVDDTYIDGVLYLVLEYSVYQYKSGAWTPLKGVGWSGSDPTAERFNSPRNNAAGECSHAEGYQTSAYGMYSHVEGEECVAIGYAQHVQGVYNIESGTNASRTGYAHIVGNGSDYFHRSNAHTLDWYGVAWYQGRPQFGGNAQDDGAQTVMGNGDKKIVLSSPNGKLWGITVTDDGVLTVTAK